MPTVAVYNQKGEKIDDLKLEQKIWDAEVNEAVLYDAIIMQQASLRQGTHKVKNRSEVNGGGRKPWKQKGTGRARQGSIRSPQWRGGGTVFGPTPRSYGYNINKKQRRVALISALSTIVKDKSLMVIDNLELSTPKTKDMKEILNNLKIDNKKVLVITNQENVNTQLASRNLPGVKVISAQGVNVLDLVNSDYLLVSLDDVKVIEEVLS